MNKTSPLPTAAALARNPTRRAGSLGFDVYSPAQFQAYLASLSLRGKHILTKTAPEPLGKRQVQKAVEDVREAIGVKEGTTD